MNVRKMLGAALGAGALIVALAGTAFAEDGNQTNVAWNAAASDCTGGPDNGQGGNDIVVPDGQVAWVFVHTGVSGPGTLTANFENAGDGITAESYVQGGLKYLIITDIPDTLLSFSDDLSGGQLTLSHTCYGSESSSTTSFTSSEESSSTSETSSTTSFSMSVSDSTTSVVPSQPNTATLGTSGSSSMSNGLWMLIAGLGVVGGSVLVLMPSRAKGKR